MNGWLLRNGARFIEYPINPNQQEPRDAVGYRQLENFEYGILVLKGEVKVNGVSYKADELAVLFDCQNAQGELDLWTEAGTHIMLLGGEPLPHPTVMWWNFVADSKEGLKSAVKDWNNGHPRFGNVNLEGTILKRLPALPLPEK